MNVKKFWLLVLVVWTGIASSCKYDDDELWDGVDDLANRVSAIEALTKQMNGDIAAIQAIVTALENRVSVSEVEKLTDGYILHLSDGTTATIKNGADGKDGEDGKDAPMVGFGEENGEYYWTLTVDGKTEWLKDANGNRLPVSDREGGKDGEDGGTGAAGANGKTPTLKVDKDGYWLVSYDGTNYTPIENESGEKISAINASEGEPYFKEVTVSDDQETVIVEMNNGEKYELPLLKALEFFADEACTVPFDIRNIPWDGTERQVVLHYKLNLDDASCEVVDNPNVKVTVHPEENRVSVSLSGNVVQDARAVVLFFNKKRTLTAVFKFVVAPWDGATSAPVTPDEYGVYEIATPAHLKWIAEQVNGGNFIGKTIKLLNDIDLDNRPWTPIGQDSSCPFSGTFDGNDKVIKGLSVVASVVGGDSDGTAVKKGAGLFGVVRDATFKRVTIMDAWVDPEKKAAGAGVLAGYVCDGATRVVDCVVKNSDVMATAVSGSPVSVGGIIGVWEKKTNASLVDITGCMVDEMILNVFAEPGSTDVPSSVGGVIGSLKVDDGLPYEVSVINNSVFHTSVMGNPSTGTGNIIFAQGAVVGNLVDLDASTSIDIIKNNFVSEEVEIETQLSISESNFDTVFDPMFLDGGGIYTFHVKGKMTQDTPLNIPSVGADVTLKFSDTGEIVINQGTGDVAGEAINKLTINVPNIMWGSEFQINAPQTSVTLASGDYSAIDKALTHKLIVGKETHVVYLKVTDGDVDVYGKITNLHRASGSTSDVFLTIFEGGQVGINHGGFRVVNMAEDGSGGGVPGIPAGEAESDE